MSGTFQNGRAALRGRDRRAVPPPPFVIVGGELRTEPVVQVAPEPAPLFLARAYQPFARALQVCGEANRLVTKEGGVRRNAYLVRQVLEESLFFGREALLPGAKPQDQKANGFAPVYERQAEPVVYGISCGRRVLEPSPAPQLDLRVGQLQRLPHGPGDGW